ncbi:hypothetical protein [Kitasatospora sp. NPDC101183]|uniref:hypothetical protein n=1 Tax=Kitasatospora sp. NPDC101183 TaxID=3364100 RepID=UPI0037F75DB8
MTTQGERTPTSGDGEETVKRRIGRGAGLGGRLTPRKAVGWVVVLGVVAAGGWIITRPMPGDYIPGLGPSHKDATKTPPVVGAAPPTTDPEGLNVDNFFPAQRVVEVGGYKAKRNGARQGLNCGEALQDRAQEVLRNSGCQAYLMVNFSGQDRPVLSTVTLLRFGDQGAAARAADRLREKPGSLTFILPDALPAPAPSGTGGKEPETPSRIEAVGHYVTVTSSRVGDGRTPGAGSSPTPSGTPGSPTPTASGPSAEQSLDEANRALSYAAGSQFVWM